MNPELNKIKIRIAKIISLCEDKSATQGEVDAGINLATMMLAKYNLTREDIDLNCLRPASKIVMGRCMVSAIKPVISKFESLLASFCCRFITNCSVYIQNATTVDEKTKLDKLINVLFFYGSKDESLMATDLFKQLRNIIVMRAALQFTSKEKANQQSYCEGFVQGISQSYKQEVDKIKLKKEDYSIMIRSEKISLAIKNESKDWLFSNFGVNVRHSGKRINSKNNESFRQGMKEGKEYDVNKNRKTIS